MRSSLRRHRIVGICVFSLVVTVVAACGGGGGDGGGGGGASTPLPTGGGNQNATGTPTPTRDATRPGQVGTQTPQGSPVPTEVPTEVPTPVELILAPGSNIRHFVRSAPDGATLILTPGMYGAVELQPGDLNGSLTILGDVTGELTQGPFAPVVIHGGVKNAAFSVAEPVDLTLDSLTFVGGNDAALLVTDSEGLTVFNCVMRSSKGDGVRIERSVSGLFFNNLVYNNAGTGIRILGTDDWFFINNTLYKNQDHGLFAGLSDATPSSNLFITNNIFNLNEPTGITVDAGDPSSLDGYFADFNLNTDGYGTDTPFGENDVNGAGSVSNPQFTFPQGGDFRMTATSPAVNAGDFDTDADLVTFLTERTTQIDGALDSPPVDLGYHYLVLPTPTPRP